MIKEIDYRGVRSLLKGIRGGNACKEGKKALKLSRRGVSVPDVLAFGIERRGIRLRRDLLITREVPDAERMMDFLLHSYPRLPFRKKDLFIKGFAVFVKRLHEAGALHPDLHMGNILVRLSEGRPQFFVLDVDRVRLKAGPLSPGQREYNLGILLSSLWATTSITERFRFLKYYGWKIRGEESPVAAIRRAALKVSRKRWKKRSKRCLVNNTGFVKETSGPFKLMRVRRHQVARILSQLLPDPDRALKCGRIVKDGRTVKAAVVELDGKPYFLKRYNPKGWAYQVKNLFRRSRAIRTWANTWGFILRGIPVPEPLVCLEERQRGLLKRSFILSEYVKDASPLSEICGRMGQDAKRRLCTKLALTLGLMHRFGASHGDLKWGNILVVRENDRRGVILTDMDASHVSGRLTRRKLLKDLERFLRDMKVYCRKESYRDAFLHAWEKWSGYKRRMRL